MAERSLLTIIVALTCLAPFLASGCDLISDLRTESVETQVVTVGRPEEEADSNSGKPTISADGRFVAFSSDATNLVNERSTGARSVYLKDLNTGQTIRISTDSGGREADGDSEHPSITADGRYIAFQSDAANLVAASADGDCVNPGGLSVDCYQVYLKDNETGATTIVSTDSNGQPGNGNSEQPSISADGRFVAFRSEAADLVAGDANSVADIFIKDLQTGMTGLVSSGSDGASADGASDLPSVSADGRIIAFKSAAANLAAGDGNNNSDVFIKDRDSGVTTMVSTAADGANGNRASGYAALAISANGQFVVFESEASNFGDQDQSFKRDIFIKNIQTGAISLMSADATGVPGADNSYASVSVSADGRLVAFSSNANNLIAGDTVNKTDVFVKDAQTGTILMVSSAPSGAPGDGTSDVIAISADAGWVAFVSEAANLADDDTNSKADIFVRDMASGTIRRVSTSSNPEETGLFDRG